MYYYTYYGLSSKLNLRTKKQCDYIVHTSFVKKKISVFNMSKRKYCEMLQQVDKSLQLMKKNKEDWGSHLFDDKFDQLQFNKLCKQIQSSDLFKNCGWNKDLGCLLATFSMGDFLKCHFCSELNPFSNYEKRRLCAVQCWSCKSALYAHFCEKCGSSCTSMEVYGPGCLKCHASICYEHAMRCIKCRSWMCEKCINKKKCIHCQ